MTKEFSKQTINDDSSEDEIYSPLSSEGINFIVDSKGKKKIIILILIKKKKQKIIMKVMKIKIMNFYLPYLIKQKKLKPFILFKWFLVILSIEIISK